MDDAEKLRRETLPERLRRAADGIEPEVTTEHFMTYEFAQHAKLMREAADDLEPLRPLDPRNL